MLFDSESSTPVILWWAVLAGIGAIGIALWLVTGYWLGKMRDNMSADLFGARKAQLALASVYAFGCAFRAFLPRADVQRIVLYDSWLSSVMLGRTVATVAELCFVVQWTLLMREAARNDGHRLARVTATVLVPMIATAELCSWYAVITTNFLGNVIEQSLWTVAVALLTVSLMALAQSCVGRLRMFMNAWTIIGVLFVLFMSQVDVPMYYHRWLVDEAAGRDYLGLSAGLRDLASRWTVTFRYQDWKDEMAWMALYFSIGVWTSISLVYVPCLHKGVTLAPRNLSRN